MLLRETRYVGNLFARGRRRSGELDGQAFLLSGPSVAIIAESAKSSPNR